MNHVTCNCTELLTNNIFSNFYFGGFFDGLHTCFQSGSIDPKLGKKLYADLNRNLGGLVLSSHLHLLYAVTPYETISHTEVHWMTYLNEVF